MRADSLLAALNIAALYATGHVAYAYIRWHQRQRMAHAGSWWRGLGLIPLMVAVVASMEFAERCYYGAARLLLLYSDTNLWQIAWPTFTVNMLFVAAMLGMLLPYHVGLGLNRRRIASELAKVATVCLIVFLVALAALA